MEKRIDYIDFIKVIGLSCIIVAHVEPTGLVYMLRQFDVVLMVLVSSILAQLSYEKYVKYNISSYKYYIRRLKRLVIPTWIFLFIYFSKCIILSGSFQDISVYINSFLLTRYGIGYVWVILIYVYSSLWIPLIYKLRTYKFTIVIVAVLYLLYEVCLYFKVGTDIPFIETTFYYIIPYGLITYIGYNYYSYSKKTRYFTISASLFLVIIIGIYYLNKFGMVQDVGRAKYPPRLYYIGYGVGVSFFILEFCRNINLKIYGCRFVKFIAKHSLWIYLWHILALDIYRKFQLPEVWYLKFWGVYIIAIVIVLVVNLFLDKTGIDEKIKIIGYFRG